MEKKPNWLVRNIKKITAVISIYPWILLLLAMMNSGPAYAALPLPLWLFFYLSFYPSLILLFQW